MGFMWFGTKDGLNRFDGNSFKVFHSDPDSPNGLGSNFIRALFVDKSGIVWAGTDRGIFLFDPVTEQFTPFHTEITNEILDIQEDDDGNIWLINALTLYRYSPSSGQLTRITDISRHPVSSLCVSGNGKVWIGTTQGQLLLYQTGAGISSQHYLFEHSPNVTSRWIERIFDSGKGFLLVGTTKQGVKRFRIADGSYTDLSTCDG